VTRSTARRGHSLIELCIALTLLIIVLGLPALLLDTSSRAFSTGSRSSEVDLAARRALDTIAERLSGSGAADIVGLLPGQPSSSIVFRAATGYAGNAIVWGNDERIELQVEPGEVIDGADNDGDGLIDEQRVLWTRDLGLPSERTQVLCTRVRRSLEGEIPGNAKDDNGNGFVDEAGLMITIDGESIGLALTVERRDAFGTAILHTARRTVALRN
jgi:hypothetical protein